jgi:hypothetical protein
MPGSTTIRIPQPCSESWAAMTPTATGRHCAACQKTVVDFTLKTDAEILAYLARAAGARTCGRFAAGQLERPLQRAAPAAPTTRWRAWLAAAVAVWGLRETVGITAQAQTKMAIQRKMGEAKAIPEHRQAQLNPDEVQLPFRVLWGVVQDTAGRAMPGATVLLKGTTIGTSTAADGRFELAVPVQAAGKLCEVQVSYIGYLPQTITLEATSEENPTILSVKLVEQAMMLGGVVPAMVIETKAYTAQPWWHPSSLYYRSKYWLTRPFR